MAAIGIFDSGIGGLTVLKALKRKLPDESFVYLGDTARLPYGSKSPMTIKRYLDQNIKFLLKEGVKAVVVACNSASTVLSLEYFPGVPVYGVIGPGAREALRVSDNKRIGVLGTRATIHSEAYTEALRSLDETVTVVPTACPLLVPLVEEGWENDSITRQVLERYLGLIIRSNVDTIILGCTHYPVLKTQIQKLVGSDIKLIDSAEVMAELIARDLEAGGIPRAQPEELTMQVFTTDVSDAFCRIAGRLMAPFQVDAWRLADLNGG